MTIEPLEEVVQIQPEIVFGSNMVWFGLKTRQEEYNIHLKHYVVISNS